MVKSYDALEKRVSQKGNTFSTFSDVDSYTWGFLNGELIILAGYPRAGKTTFLMNILRTNMVDYTSHMACFSLDGSAKAFFRKVVRFETKERKERTNHYLKLYNSSTINVETVADRCKTLKQEGNVRMAVIDYLEFKHGSEKFILNKLQFLKDLAIEINIPILVVLSIPDDNIKRAFQFPKLKDLGKLEPIADMVLFIRKKAKEPLKKDQFSEIDIVKNPAEQYGLVEIRYESHSGLLYDVADQWDSQVAEHQKDIRTPDQITPF